MTQSHPDDHVPDAADANPSGADANPSGADVGQRWVVATTSDKVVEGGALEVLVEDRILAIFRHQGMLYALDGMCAHQGGPLAQGKVQHGCVTCPWHGWQYELATGIQTINRQPLQQTFPVRESNNQVEVRIE